MRKACVHSAMSGECKDRLSATELGLDRGLGPGGFFFPGTELAMIGFYKW